MSKKVTHVIWSHFSSGCGPFRKAQPEAQSILCGNIIAFCIPFSPLSGSPFVISVSDTREKVKNSTSVCSIMVEEHLGGSWVVQGTGVCSVVHKLRLKHFPTNAWGLSMGTGECQAVPSVFWSSELCHPARLQASASLPQNDPKAPLPAETQIFPFAHPWLLPHTRGQKCLITKMTL